MSIALVVMAGTIGAAIKTEWLKSKQLDLDEKTKKKILEEGIYHITTKEVAESIVKDGYIRPSRGLANNHFTRSKYGDGFADLVYMFAGMPTKEMYRQNISHISNKDGTIYAVKHTPDRFELENYTQRLEDGAITYEGRLDIANSNPQVVRLKYEKGKFIEIPLDAEVKLNLIKKLSEGKIMKRIKGISSGVRELGRNTKFIDTTRKLKACMEKRRLENKYIAQFNTEKQNKIINISKDEKNYKFVTIGTKKQDGKVLTGFRMAEDTTGLEKNIFMDGMDLNSISDEHLSIFLTKNMNESSERSEYIGKPVIKDGEVSQEIDDEFAHHFYSKQLLAMRNDSAYNEYLEKLKKAKEKKLSVMYEEYLKTNAERRKMAMQYIKKFIQLGKNKTIDTREMNIGELDGRY